jgi:carbonic anhydrase
MHHDRPPPRRRASGRGRSSACSNAFAADGKAQRTGADDRLAALRASVSGAFMSVIDELIANNRAFASSAPHGHFDVRPSLRLAVVTCMDSRINVFAMLGLRDGEAHILRNAGGVITDDVIRSLAISQRRLGTREVMLIHHSRCGMQTLTDDEFRAELQQATGVAPAFAIESFDDLDADVRQSILRVRRSPFLAHRDLIRGFVYDVDSHALREIHVEDVGLALA